MELNEFIPLNKEQRNEIVLDQGVFIASRQERGYTFLLFQVYDFYVERVYHKNNETFLGFVAFWSRSERLEPYLSQVKIERLLM
jgi:hypothetical protein